jgi:UDP-2-acetamido-3-amino-2,3-dideoxy-glucuronate N-acetyltransferase
MTDSAAAPPPYVHPTAVVDPGAVLGAGAKVWHFCHVSAGARIGRGVVLGQNVFVAGSVVVGDRCKIQNNVSLYDGVILEDDVFVGPSAVFTNVSRPRAAFPRRDRFEPTHVRAGASLGANCTVVCGREIGRGAFVAAGAVVTHDVAPFTLVRGAPARPAGFVCACGEAVAPPDYHCSACGRAYAPAAAGLTELRP